jgi:hypothetical protein
MRPILIGLVAAFMAATLIPAVATAATPPKPAPIDPASKAKGMKDAPGVITTAGLDCQLVDARSLGASTDPKTKVTTNFYEIACKDAEGFIVGVTDKPPGPPPVIYTCLEVAASGAANIACILPENLDPKAGLATMIEKVKPDCQVSNDRSIGQTSDRATTVFEVACQGGAGYVVDTSFPISTAKPMTFHSCLAFGATAADRCTLTDAAAQDAFFATLVAKIGKPCTPTGHRWVGEASSGSNFFEVSCQDGKGYMFELKPDGTIGQGIDCAQADNIGGGCTLTNSREAQSQEDALYTKLAQASGFNCTVSQYSPFDVNVPGHEVVELACSNRPDGAVALFPADSTQKGVFYDCAHSELAGYRCSFTKPDAAFPNLTADLNKLGKSSCVVSGERVIGVDANKVGYIEVACADGNPGYVVSYNTADMTPKEATSCPLAKNIAGGCQLPANLPKH